MPHFTGRSEITATALGSHGFYTAEALDAVARDPATRLHMVLVRFHEGRLLCPAQDALSIITALDTATPPWTLRDVSQPTTDPIAAEALNLLARQRHAARVFAGDDCLRQHSGTEHHRYIDEDRS